MAETDIVTGADIVVDFAHHEIHEGDAFVATYTEDLAGAAARDILITTPNTTKWVHMTWQVTGELETHVSAWEAPTATASANAITAYNRNRNSATASGLAICHTPTDVTTGSVLIMDAHFGTGRSVGGGRSDDDEWILDQNAKYLLRITNAVPGSSNYISVFLSWYEHTSEG